VNMQLEIVGQDSPEDLDLLMEESWAFHPLEDSWAFHSWRTLAWQRRPRHFRAIEWDTSIEHNFRPPKFPASTFEEQKARGFWGDTLRYADHCVVDEDGKPGQFVAYADFQAIIIGRRP